MTSAGCLRNGDSAASVYGSFFALSSLTNSVSEGGIEVENAVPVGQHGHAWSPDTGLRTDIVGSDIFVYLDLQGFQSWALDFAEDIRDNHPETVLVDGSDGVSLMEYEGHHDHGQADEHSDDEHHGDEHHGDEDHEEHGDEHGDDEHHGDEHHGDEHHEEHGDEHHDHDHGDYDPHFWLDPVRAQEIVRNIEDGLVEADPDNAGTYETNADEVVGRLEELHETYEEELSGAEHDLLVVAGHDSFGYIADRYGFDVRATEGVAPDSTPSLGEVSDTVNVVEEHGIKHIAYDAFESPNLAETIVEAIDGEGVVELTPMESTFNDWEGMGYIEQMEEINLPALKTALGAD